MIYGEGSLDAIEQSPQPKLSSEFEPQTYKDHTSFKLFLGIFSAWINFLTAFFEQQESSPKFLGNSSVTNCKLSNPNQHLKHLNLLSQFCRNRSVCEWSIIWAISLAKSLAVVLFVAVKICCKDEKFRWSNILFGPHFDVRCVAFFSVWNAILMWAGCWLNYGQDDLSASC